MANFFWFSCLYSNNRLAKQKGKESRKKNNGKYDLQQEILGALFAAPERVEELPKKISARPRGPRTYGRTAVEVSKETEIEQSFVAVKPLAGRSEGKPLPVYTNLVTCSIT